jgi:DNA primase
MCCEFHDEKKESLSMNTETGQWICFGCGLKGNLFQFVARSYNISYQKAKEFVLVRGGLANANLDDILFLRDIKMNLAQDKEIEKVQWHNFTEAEIAVMYESPDPYDYLIKRGFTPETVEYFECGFTSKWRGRDPETEETRYEPRITIPGHNKEGKIAGFIGRTPIDQTPKYRYSFGYPKSQTLFNLHRAKKHADAGLIVVEGSTDVMRIHQFGYPNVVGALGAKLSDEQLRLLTETTDTVFLMFDNDAAGKMATENAIKDLEEKVHVNYIGLPEGLKDPDSLESKEQFEELYENHVSWFGYKLMREVTK